MSQEKSKEMSQDVKLTRTLDVQLEVNLISDVQLASDVKLVNLLVIVWFGQSSGNRLVRSIVW